MALVTLQEEAVGTLKRVITLMFHLASYLVFMLEQEELEQKEVILLLRGMVLSLLMPMVEETSLTVMAA